MPSAPNSAATATPPPPLSTARGLLVAAAVLYVLGVQLPTIRGNVPLNNQLQASELTAMSEPELAEARHLFEPSWNRLNIFRTVVSIIVAILLILVSVLR